MNSTENGETQIVYSRWLVIAVFGAFLFSLTMLAVGWLAWVIEEDQSAPFLMLVWIAFAGGLAYFCATLPRQIVVGDGVVTLCWWWRTKTVNVDAVTAVAGNTCSVTLTMANERARFSFLYPNQAANLLTFLEDHIPVAGAARDARRQRELPIVLRPRLTAPVMMGGMGLLILGVGAALFWSIISGDIVERVAGGIGMGAVGLLITLVGGGFVALVLTQYTWVTTFDHDTIRLRGTFGTQTYDPRYMTKLELRSEERTIKGFIHQIYQLRLHFMDGSHVDIAPNLPSFPTDYAGAAEARQLSEVKAALERHYAPVVSTEIDPRRYSALNQTQSFGWGRNAGFDCNRSIMAEERWGTPQAVQQWVIHPYDLAVYRLDYGEHHAAASTVHFLVGHVEAGAMRFRTTNGEIRISPDGRYLVLFDATLLVAFNLDNGRIYHRSSRQGWLYHGVQIDGELLLIEEMRRTNAHDRAGRKPISLEQPTSALRRGFGPAEQGDFPSAYE